MSEPRAGFPYRRSGDGIVVVSPMVADERDDPRELTGAQTVSFTFTDQGVLDESSRELALLLEQAAGWLRAHPGVGPLSIAFHDFDRMTLLLTVE